MRLQALYGLFATLHWALAYRFLVTERGFGLVATLMVPLIIYLASTLLLLGLPRFEARNGLRLGFALRILAIVPFAVWPTFLGIYLGSIAFGLAMVLFWVPYNIMFFEHREKTNRAGMSATYAAIAPFTDIAATLAAGFIVVRYGYPSLFFAAILVGLVPLAITTRLTPRSPMPMALWERFGRLGGLRSIMFLGGLSQGVLWPAIPIVTLFFIEGTFAYAAFFAIIGLGGAVAGILLGRFSDRRAKRLLFIMPFAFLFGLANLLSAFAVGVVQWGVWRGLATFSHALFEPFNNVVLLDRAESVIDLYVVREFLLNIGRVTGVLVLVVALHFNALQLALIVPGAIGFLVPLIIEAKDLYPDERLVVKPIRTLFRQ